MPTTLGALGAVSLHTSIVGVKCLHTYKDYHLQHKWMNRHPWCPNLVYGLDWSIIYELDRSRVYGLSYIYNAYNRFFDLF